MILWYIFVTTCILIYMYWIRPLRQWSERKVPHVTPLPIVGNMGRTTLKLTSMAETMVDLYAKFKGYAYFGYYQYLQPSIILRDIELIKKIAIKDFEHFTDHNNIIDENLDPLFGKNLFSLRGQKWRDMRTILSPAFTSSKMRNMFTMINDSAEQFVRHFESKSKKTETISLEMKDAITRFANDVIATCAFGVQCDSLGQPDNEFYVMGKETTNFTGLRMFKFFGYNISPFLMRLFKVRLFSEECCNFFRSLVRNTMETREREGIVRPDMIHLLMEAKKGNLKHESKTPAADAGAGFATVQEFESGTGLNKGQNMTHDEMCAQVVLFFFAGFDSISGAMCHMANELAINPDIQKRLQDEIDEVFENAPNGKITYENVLKMQYLDMVLSESLRKWPAAIFTDRVCKNSGYMLPPPKENEEPLRLLKNDILIIPIFCLHRDPELFPNPEKFDPERFSEENNDNIKPFSYVPFGAGPRNCIGSRFALLEAKTFFVHLLRKFNIIVTDKTQIPLKLHPASFNLNAEKGFWLGFQPRTVA